MDSCDKRIFAENPASCNSEIWMFFYFASSQAKNNLPFVSQIEFSNKMDISLLRSVVTARKVVLRKLNFVFFLFHLEVNGCPRLNFDRQFCDIRLRDNGWRRIQKCYIDPTVPVKTRNTTVT